MKETIAHILDHIGRLGRHIAFATSVAILYRTGAHVALGYYIFGSMMCTIINVILKIIIKQPRPKDDTPDFNFLIQMHKRVSYDKFGMPSGHSQFMFFTLAFMALFMRDHKRYWWMIAFFIALTVITLVQRYVDNNHTIIQLVVGALIGTFIGASAFFITKSKLKGKLREKEDDNALFIP